MSCKLLGIIAESDIKLKWITSCLKGQHNSPTYIGPPSITSSKGKNCAFLKKLGLQDLQLARQLKQSAHRIINLLDHIVFNSGLRIQAMTTRETYIGWLTTHFWFLDPLMPVLETSAGYLSLFL
jgi:hypothetical protein